MAIVAVDFSRAQQILPVRGKGRKQKNKHGFKGINI